MTPRVVHIVLICDAYGLDSVPYTLGYVATWADGDADAVLATAKTVRETASVILAGAGVRAA